MIHQYARHTNYNDSCDKCYKNIQKVQNILNFRFLQGTFSAIETLHPIVPTLKGKSAAL